MTTKPTRIAGRYDLGDVVGRGGIGTVYRAIQQPLERPVALKMLRPEFSEHPTIRRRFVREARTVAALAHPNIATVHDFGVDEEDRLFLVLEFVEGESLESLGQRGALDLPAIARIFHQVLTGLGHAHARGVIHRDIKPANILVTHDEAGLPWVKIVDFGIAAVTGVTGFDEDLASGSGQIVGTPQYMAPEQVRGERHVSATVDVYAVALTLFWALTGSHAFDGGSAVEVLSLQLHQPPPPLVPKPGISLPAGVDALLARALAKSPSERVPSALALRAALEERIGTGDDARVTGVGTLSLENARRTVVELTGLDVDAAGLDEPLGLPQRSDDAARAPLTTGVELPALESESRGGGALVPAAIAHTPTLLPSPAAPGALALVRREERTRLLDEVWRTLDDARGLLLTIEGISGFGKSRMAAWVATEAAERTGARVVRGAFLRESGYSLRGVRDALDDLLHLRGASTRRVAEQVASLAPRCGLDPHDVRALVEFLRPSTAERTTHKRAPEALYHVLLQLLSHEAEKQPLVLLLDDLHFGGAETGHFLEFLAVELQQHPVPLAVIASVLTGDVSATAFADALRRLSRYEGEGVVRHALLPLDPQDAETLVDSVVRLAPDVRASLIQRAAGNEMHLVQLVRYLVERKLLTQTGEGWRPRPGVKVDELLPPSLTELVELRLADLEAMGPAGMRRLELLRRGAVLGRSFRFQVLERMLDIEHRTDLLETVDEDVDGLLDLDLWRIRGEQSDDVLSFSASMTRDVLVDRMRGRRMTRRLHLFAAEAKLAVLHESTEKIAGDLVVHFEQARDGARAYQFARLAAEVAERTHRPHAAAEFLERALTHATHDEREAVHDLRIRAAGLWTALGEYPLAARHFDAVLEDSPAERARARALFGHAKIHRLRGGADAAEAGYTEGLQAAGEESDLRSVGVLGLARVAWHRGRHVEARARALDALSLARSGERPRLVAESLWLLADVARSRGDHEPARDLFQQAMALYEEHDDRLGIAKCHAMLAMGARASSDLDAAEEHYRQALAIYRNYGERKGVAHQLNGLGDVARFRGDFAGAADHYRRAVDIFQRLELPFDTAVALTNLGIVARESADFERAEDAFRRALSVAEKADGAYLVAGAGLCLAHVLELLGRHDEADAFLERALAAAENAEIVDPDFAVPLERLAELRAAGGEEGSARDLLQRAYDMWSELGRTHDADRVARRIAETR